jgi:protein-S-isoprenylcysteine O-methyltransferase Ste14
MSVFNALVVGLFMLAAGIWVLLLLVTAPYGRHSRCGWGPKMADRMGWVVMEAPAPLVFAACFALGDFTRTVPEMVFFGLWQAHYLHRSFVYPFGPRGSNRGMPVVVVAAGFMFNAVNGYVNGRPVFTFSSGYPDAWMADVRFVGGLLLFVMGSVINRHSDRILRLLRQPGDTTYHVPHGGMYRWVSSPNYLGEIVEWIGWAVATWSLAGLAFAAWAAANLVPRARAHHLWYRERFADYPRERKALVPGVW